MMSKKTYSSVPEMIRDTCEDKEWGERTAAAIEAHGAKIDKIAATLRELSPDDRLMVAVQVDGPKSFAAKAAVTWTTEMPSEPGRWYWVRSEGRQPRILFLAELQERLMFVSDTTIFPDGTFSAFSGPIPEPAEPTR